MHLINISTLTALTLEDFIGDDVPPYGILSHTWDKEEVSFQAFSTLEARSFAGYRKIQGFCAIAAEDGLSYVWVDTCCIDKASSAELSEAINSMYRWYANAKSCYVYLSDLECSLPSRNPFVRNTSEKWDEMSFRIIKDCRWFKRGWTLQELLAPVHIKFYNRQWISLGTKSTLANVLSRATAIKAVHLWGGGGASIAQRMSWAAHRVTTRSEDRAYCLLGIFDVNMPLLYGEGKKAFVRLQQEILRSSHDESLFAWTNERLWTSGMLAESPADFAGSSNIVPIENSSQRRRPYFMTNHGLQIELGRMHVDPAKVERCRFKSPLLCKIDSFPIPKQVCLYFYQTHDNPDEEHLVRAAPYELDLIDMDIAMRALHDSQLVASFFVQDTTLLKQEPQRLIQRNFPTAASLHLHTRGLVDYIDFSRIREMPAGKLGLFITDLANPYKFETTYLCWPKEDCDPKVLEIYCRDFNFFGNSWQHMNEWQRQISTQKAKRHELRIGHPCAMWYGTAFVTLIAVRRSTSQGLSLEIQVSELMKNEGDIPKHNIQMKWIGASKIQTR